MAGLLDDPGTGAPPMQQDPAAPQPPGPGAPPMQDPAQGGAEDGQASERLRDEILSKIQEQQPEMAEPIQRIALVGKKIMFDDKTSKMAMESLDDVQAENAPEQIAKAIAGLMSLVEGQAKGPLPPQAMIGASAILLSEAINFLSEAGVIQETNDLVAEATQNLMGYMLQKYRIDPSQIKPGGQQGQSPLDGGVSPQQDQPAAPGGPAPQAQPGLLQDGGM